MVQVHRATTQITTTGATKTTITVTKALGTTTSTRVTAVTMAGISTMVAAAVAAIRVGVAQEITRTIRVIDSTRTIMLIIRIIAAVSISRV